MIIKTDKDTFTHYLEDASGMIGATAEKLFIPETKEEVSSLLKECSDKKIPVTVAAGCTGVTGGCLAYGGVILSTEKFNFIGPIRKISDDKALITAGSGTIVNEIKSYVLQNGWMYAPDPTEKNATIGGNISTDASGGRGFKYGTTRNYINAIEIVFCDGSFAKIKRGENFADDKGTIILKTNLGTITIT